jgi:hypothetical protein
MSDIISFEKPFCKIVYSEENNFVFAKWSGRGEIEKIKEGTNAYLDAMIKHKCGTVLVDLSDATGTFTYANDWINHDWAPRAVKSGLKCLAMVYNSDVFTKFTLDKLNQGYQKLEVKYFEMMTFNDKQEALRWIEGLRASGKSV